MKLAVLMGLSAILIGCSLGPTKEDTEREQNFLTALRDCGEAATIARVSLEYDCSVADCKLDACAIKLCGAEKFGDTVQIDKVEIDEGRCEASFGVQK